MKSIFSLILSVLMLSSAFAESKVFDEGSGTKKADEVIHDALYSEYILAYKEFRNTLYKQVWQLKKMKLSDSAMAEIKKTYFPLQAESKKWINEMMNDLLDKKARKQIESNPEVFEEKYKNQLVGIINNYQSNFLVQYNKNTNQQDRFGIDAGIQLAQKLFSWFKQMWGVDKEYLRVKYEEPLLIKSWSEVAEDDIIE